MPANDDPYYPYSIITHNGVTSADTGVPTQERQFVPRIESAVLNCAANLTAGSATVTLQTYDGRLDAWCNGTAIDLNPGLTAWKWDTAGRRVAVTVTAISGGTLTISAVIADNRVAGL